MPTGQPAMFRAADERRAARAAEAQTEVLGEIRATPAPETPGVTYQTAGGPAMTIAEPPPPWEIEDEQFMLSDARRFIDVPPTWTLRWVNPRLLESQGWQHWSPISASDPRVRVKVESMVAPDGTVRRGGISTGDILAWMYTSWVESRRRVLAQETAKMTQSAVDRQAQLREQFQRAGLVLESAVHPTHTMADGRSLQRDV